MTSQAIAAAQSAGLAHRVIRHGPVRSLAEAAEARGVEPADVVKTMVVRRGPDDFVFVLVPGDRAISWPKLRGVLGVSRLSMPDAATAQAATGYVRGTITPLGSSTAWPVIADERITGRDVTLGAGEHGVAIGVSADELIGAVGAVVADVTDPESDTA
jgi:Cys-tRNA(Pro)/Cys-tRNA(Cys) deacylase